MRIGFTSDLHGHEALYSQLDAFIRRETPDLLILGGDLFPDGDLDDPVGTQGRYVDQVFIPRLRRWRGEHPGMRVAAILGNHDWLSTQAALLECQARGELVSLDHRRPLDLGEVRLLGYSHTPPTPYWVKDFERLDLPGDEIPMTGGAVWDAKGRRVTQATAEEYFRDQPSIASDLASASIPDAPWIFVCHAPPFETKLDRLPHLDYPVGSRAVRDFITVRQPLCSLHGHIHESPGLTGSFVETIGSTLCINPGQTNTQLHAVVFDTRDLRGSLRHTVLR